MVMETLPHDKYAIKLDGSGCVTYRNLRFLKKYVPAIPTMSRDQTPPSLARDYRHSTVLEPNDTIGTETSGKSTLPIATYPPVHSSHAHNNDDDTAPCNEPASTASEGVSSPSLLTPTRATGSAKTVLLTVRQIRHFNDPGLK